MKAYRIILFFLFGSAFLVSQEQRQIDSVKNAIPSLKSDTSRIRAYLTLAEWLSDLDEWSGYNNKALELINKLYDGASGPEKELLKKQKANALNNLGLYYKEKNLYDPALENYEKSLVLNRELKNTEGVAVTLVNIAAIEIARGKVTEGILKNTEALKIFRDSLHDKSKTATVMVNIGHLYYTEGNFQEALKYYGEALKINKEIKSDQGEGLVYTNFGHLYGALKEFKTAFEFYEKASNIYIKLNDRRRIAYAYLNMSSSLYHLDRKRSTYYDSLALNIYLNLEDNQGLAKCYHNIGAYQSDEGNVKLAKSLHTRALHIREKLDDLGDIFMSQYQLALIYIKTNQLDSAEYMALEAQKIAQKTGYNLLIRDAALTLSRVYKAKKQYEKALDYYISYKAYNDSVFSSESKNAANRQLSQLEFEKKEFEMKAVQEKEELILKGELGKQQAQRNAFLIGFAVVTVLLFFVFKNYREKKKANVLITEQKKEVEHAKELIEEKNKEITDSINYAKRIQEAALPDKELKYKLFPDAFVLFQPRDIVSGDFYWYTEKDGKRLIAAVDCTGHGVPGAFMSLIGTTFLNEIVNVKGTTDPAEILNQLRQQVITSLKQSGGENKDGMDISILCFDKENKWVEYAGANNPLWLARNFNITEYKADKQPIGYYVGEPKPFTRQKIELQKNDTLYIFTDGFADQFGGDKGKKFKYQPLKEFLIDINERTMMDQESLLLERFKAWKGSLDQIDDVCIIGVRV